MKTSKFINPPCPHLPKVSPPLAITHTRQYRQACDQKFFQACLELAQSLWLLGSPAQAILQLDKSMMASTASSADPIDYPYAAILWIIRHTPDHQFIGNPVRHFQHLASRMNMNQPSAEIRIWRAWACLHLTEALIPNAETLYPRDQKQIENEGLHIPSLKEVLSEITHLSSLIESDSITRLV